MSLALRASAALFLYPAAITAALSGSEAALLYDACATHDVASLDPLAAFGRLVVLRITPATDSGAAVAADQPIDSRGNPPAQPQGPYAIQQAGNWELLDSLGQGSLRSGGTYRWTKVPRAHPRKLEVDDYYSPFSYGGVVLCELHPEASGNDQFRLVSLLPASWAQAPRAAFEVVRRQPAPFRDPPTPAHRQILAAMVGGREPLLACMAFRRLLQLREFGAAELDKSIARSAGYERAGFVYLAILDARDRPGSAAEKILRHTVETSPVVRSLRFTALGIFSVRLLYPEVAQECPWTTGMLATVQAAVRRSGRAADPFFSRMFEIMDLRSQ
jgi:hypothetical protein